MSRRARLIAAILAAPLAGCVSVLPEADPPAPRFALTPVAGAAEYAGLGDSLAGGHVGWALVIDDPVASRAIDTTKIALKDEPEQYRYFSGGEWTDRTPRLVELALVRSFENSGRILGVGGRANIAAADLVLQTDVRAFEAQVAGRGRAPDAVVEIYARLTDLRGETLAARLFSARVAAGSDEASDVASAINAAAGQTITEIVDWTFESGSASRG
ncbi:MAG: ABC-type transport auxiliary lipoprotein family protein [Parvularculaceae bacterium]